MTIFVILAATFVAASFIVFIVSEKKSKVYSFFLNLFVFYINTRLVTWKFLLHLPTKQVILISPKTCKVQLLLLNPLFPRPNFIDHDGNTYGLANGVICVVVGGEVNSQHW